MKKKVTGAASKNEISEEKTVEVLAKKLSDILEDATNDEKQFQRYLLKEKTEDGRMIYEEKTFEKVDMDSLNSAIKALKSLEELKRAMTEGSEAQGGSESDKSETGVVLLPEIKEDNDEA